MSPSKSEFDYMRVEERDGGVVVRFTVPVLSEEINLEHLGHELFALIDRSNCRKLAVDMKGVRYLTSSGLGKLITLHRKMHRQQGVVVFCDIEESVLEILRSSRLNTYFRIVANLDAALAELAGAPDADGAEKDPA